MPDPRRGHHWSYPARLTGDRSTTVLRGRVLGGSTATNGGYFVRARVEDFAAWSQSGNPAWAYQNVLPFLRALENDLDYGPTDVHGGSGPVPVQRPALTGRTTSAFAAAADELGFPFEPDKNDQGTPGFGPVPRNVKDGVRWNSGLAYVLPALTRPNLTVLGGCTVPRIRFLGTRAVGVDIHVDGSDSTVAADTVVLCAGAFETPGLLLRSGIGPADDLRRLGIPVVGDLPGVGRRFSDHPQVVLEWTPTDYLDRGSDSWISACLNFRSADGPASGDLQILPSNVPLSVLTGHPPVTSELTLPLLISALTPTPSGSLRLVSTDPRTALDISYGYLSTAGDRERLRQAVRTALALVSTRAFGPVRGGPTDLDDRTAADDRSLDRWIRERLGTSLHASGSAPMGSADDPATVVDQFGRVHGISGLRIADTSILPAAPLRGPAATAVLIGEVIAHSLRR